MNVAIVDYGAGNPLSVKLALERLGQTSQLTSCPGEIATADKIIIPGVGNAASAMRALTERKLLKGLQSTKKPLLGICLGMQLLFEASDEGSVDCLQVLPGRVSKLSPSKKIPHVGWNEVKAFSSSSPPRLLRGISSAYFYFVHSFKVGRIVQGDFSAFTTYGDETFTSVVEQANFFGVQFHPERSGEAGSQLLKNFLEINDV